MDAKLLDVLEGKEKNYIIPLFWQHGENEEILRDEMKMINSTGIGSVCLEARPHPEFMVEKWWRDVDIILDEAKKLGMKIWIFDDAV